ncbi:glucose-1-phosphate thymidylyltransferase RfbA [Micromonospora antibiotica]|uniref:Glucose-1-phosphate thymidylyltransferase n=1 Tax=Micromonospora antibiotica TaxID=2807623 RepID=A0ABS3V2E1_9ACTN|nr:glucose-1-phosphate thymidylyltransferase RfbA [Micromonospora antibiotica]MBO4159737.1 glucose-1-phosphate thymidylyltransferase RfbA [Micromonospora antibiotica]
MRGIVLAGGSGTRLRPATKALSKQLLPVYDKPMIYYPLSVLMLTGIRDVLIISTPDHLSLYQQLFETGAELGLNIEYAVQERPGGLAEAFLLGADFIGDENVCLVLGDNIFHGTDLGPLLRAEAEQVSGCTLFTYPVSDPTRYGIAELDRDGSLVRLAEKPISPSSNQAVTGLYLYTPDVVDHARALTPSARGELEITDLNNRYLGEGRARIVGLGPETVWLDTGTHDSLLAAGNVVQLLQHRNEPVACLEAIAWRMGFISTRQMVRLTRNYPEGSAVATYLAGLLAREPLGFEAFA